MQLGSKENQFLAKKEKRRNKVKAQLDLTVQQKKKEIKNLKVTQSLSICLPKLVNTITQAMTCMYVGTAKKPTENKPSSKKTFQGILGPMNCPRA